LSAIRAVIFDCDGVLVDSAIIAVEIEIATLAQAGLVYDVLEFKTRFTGMSDVAFYAALDEDGRARLGHPVMAEVAPIMEARKRMAMDSRLAEVPGATQAVVKLRKLKAVATSSTTEQMERKLKRVGLWDHFHPHLYSADHVVRSKPAPDLFLYAAERLGVDARDCLVVEDSINGVKAAHAAGMRVWGFLGGSHMDETTGRKLSAAGAERLVPDWPAFDSLMRD
jgi:HAD superfamily hydrolase (TIGR01549 family)